MPLAAQADRPPVYAMGRKPGTNAFRPLRDHPDDQTFPGLLIAGTEGRLFFANITWVIDKLWPLVHPASPRILTLDCSAVPDIEYTALKSLTEFEEQLSKAGTKLWLAALNAKPLDVIERAPLGMTLGQERIFLNLEQALEAYQLEKNQGTSHE